MTQEERKLYDAANKYAWDIESGDLNTNRDSFIAGANWQYEQFEKERLKHCDELTAEQAQIESDFVVQHLKKNNRTPTFIDAIEYGMRLQKERLIPNTADAMIGLPYENKDGGYTHLIDVSRPLPVGNNKIAIIFKEEQQ